MSKAPEHMSQQELESYLWGAAKLLRGLIDAGDYKQFVFPLLFFKRLSDVWDEEHRAALDEIGCGHVAGEALVVEHVGLVRLPGGLVPDVETGDRSPEVVRQVP